MRSNQEANIDDFLSELSSLLSLAESKVSEKAQLSEDASYWIGRWESSKRAYELAKVYLTPPEDEL